MSHNIQIDHSQLKGALFTVHSESTDQDFRVLFHPGGYNAPPCLTLDPTFYGEEGNAKPVRVEREDLYAFRELLNELPEEAFVRPKDPDPESYVVKDSDGAWWELAPTSERWRVVWMEGTGVVTGNTGGLGLDDFPDDHIDKGKPRWTDGDIVRPNNGRNNITYIRRAGEWDRHYTDNLNGHATVRYLDLTDAEIDALIRAGYSVLYQQNA